MSKNRDDKTGYIFCSAETKEKMAEFAKRSGADTPADDVFVVADIIPYGFCVVATKDDFMGWLFARGNDHDIWTVPEEDLNDPNKTV